MVNGLEPCDCLWIKRERRRLAQYVDFEHMTFESFEGNDEAKRVLKAFARKENSYRFVVLKGPTGTGKTHLSVAAIKAAHEAGIVARIAYVSRLFDELRQAIELETGDEVFRYYADTPLLAIDDQGLENATNWTAERWDYLINERYTLGVKTIIGTNLDTNKIPARIADRIFDAQYGITIELQGDSHRGRQ